MIPSNWGISTRSHPIRGPRRDHIFIVRNYLSMEGRHPSTALHEQLAIPFLVTRSHSGPHLTIQSYHTIPPYDIVAILFAMVAVAIVPCGFNTVYEYYTVSRVELLPCGSN